MELKITGMRCQYRVCAVTAALQAVQGEVSVECLGLESGRSLIVRDAGPGALAAAVQDAGYRAELVAG